MRRFLLPVLLLVLAAVSLVVNVPVFHVTGSANLSALFIVLSFISAFAALCVAAWRLLRG